MIKIEILTNDLILGDFSASDYGLIIGSFTYSGESQDTIGMDISTIEEYVGYNPIPTYLGQKYTNKLALQITLVKNFYTYSYKNIYFSEKDCRWILRKLTGIKGYQWLKLITNELDEDLWYKARINSVSYERIGGHVAGIILNMECDSCFAWSGEKIITIQAKANQSFFVYNNTDDLSNYVYPIVSILSSSDGTLYITNKIDNRVSEIKNVKKNEKIVIDSQHEIITSTNHELLLDDFNLCWIRLLPDKNEYICNKNAVITMKFRVPRKVGIVE